MRTRVRNRQRRTQVTVAPCFDAECDGERIIVMNYGVEQARTLSMVGVTCAAKSDGGDLMVRTINGVVPIEDALDGHEHGSRRRDCIGAHAILSFAETDKASRRSRRAKVVNDRKAIRRAVTVKNLWAGRAKGLEEHMPEEAEAIVG